MSTSDTAAPTLGDAILDDAEGALPMVGELVAAANPGLGLALEILPTVVPEVFGLIQRLAARTGAPASTVAAAVAAAGQHAQRSTGPTLAGSAMGADLPGS